MTSFKGQVSSAKMMSLGGKLTALACHPTKRVNKSEELTYLYTNIKPSVMTVGPCTKNLSYGYDSHLGSGYLAIFNLTTQLLLTCKPTTLNS
jgi:hypothetical protein